MSGYRRKWASYELLRKNRRESASPDKKPRESLRGIGISLAYQGNSLLHQYREQKSPEEGVELTLEKDGVLEIRTEVPWGDNQLRIWHELAAKILGVEKIRLVSKREAANNVPESGPACLSRSVGILTPLVEKACTAIRKQRFRDPLPITVHRYYHAAKVPAWGEAVKIDENALASPGWGCAVVEAELDPASYIPKVRGIWLCIDGGTILSDERAKKSVGSASLRALSWAMGEEVVYRDGKIDEAKFRDYTLWPDDLPPVAVDFLWSEGTPRGIGELPFATIPSAYAQALSQALDYHFCRYPVCPKDIWAAVQAISGEKS
jgi:CO/xanthine dehydrogenase Mo-binding subunit